MMRIVIDSNSYADIGAYRWPYKIGYLNHPNSAWTPDQITDADKRGELLGLIDVSGRDASAAAIIAWGPGDVQAEGTLSGWVNARNIRNDDAAVLCAANELTEVINEIGPDQHWYLWLAQPTPNSEPPLTPPPLGLPENVTLLGILYALAPQSGGNYNMSIFYDDSWHAPAVNAEPPAAVEDAASAADVEEAPQNPGQNMNPPMAAEPPSAPEAGSAASPASSPTALRPVPASALSRSGAIAPAQSSTPSPSGPSLLATRPIFGEAARAANLVQSPTTLDNQPSAPFGVVGEQLPHGWIGGILADVDTVAKMFRQVGASQTAGQLEAAAAHGIEVGKLIQKAGL
jgi:hypothetical protein